MRPPLGNLFRFCVVGGLVAVFDFAMIWLFSTVWPGLAAVAVAYLLAVTLHFCLNRRWVFGARAAPVGGQLTRYTITVAACWICTVATTALALGAITGNLYFAKAISLLPTTVLGFALMRSFVFRPPPSSGAR